MRGKVVTPALLLLGSLAYFTGSLNHWVGSGGGVVPSYITVKISQGSIRGIRQVSRSGRSFYEFRGIRYAKSPIGILRFEPPVKPDSWEGVIDATRFGPTCLQYEYLTKILQGSEDCLYLNVASHKVASRKGVKPLFPVIVFIHGGAFMSGFSNVYRPSYLLDEDLVLVTINYRLSSFGFLNTGDDVVRGNMGLKDQVLGLQWVQENIMYFGGDPSLVTIVGESAGAASVHLHMLSPLSKGLFHRAIGQSGNALSFFSLQTKPRKQALRLGQMMNCPVTNTTEMVYCLKSKQALELNAVHQEYLDFFSPREAYFAPSIEAVNDSGTFLSAHPRRLIEEQKIHKVPLIIGANSDEGLLFIVDALTNRTRFAGLNNNWDEHAPIIFHYEDEPAERKKNISRQIRKFYMGNKLLSMDTMQAAVNLFSDRFFFEGLHDTALLQAKYSPVYTYYYTYQGQLGFANILFGMTRFLPEPLDAVWSASYNWFSSNILLRKPRRYGVCHSDELPIFFNLPVVAQEIIPGTVDYEFSREAVRIWSSFARTGKPDKIFGVEWEPVSKNALNDPDSIKYLKFDEQPAMINESFRDRIAFWKSLGLDPYS